MKTLEPEEQVVGISPRKPLDMNDPYVGMRSATIADNTLLPTEFVHCRINGFLEFEKPKFNPFGLLTYIQHP
jgi:hypothetical protein